MPAAPASSEGWFHFLTADAQVVGIVTWIGLLVTIAGFGIAIAQLRKIKKSSEAASDAVSGLVKVVRSQEQNAKVTDALGHLRSAQTMIKQSNAEAAAEYLSVGWNALVAASELSGNVDDRRLIESFMFSTRKLHDDLSAPRLLSRPLIQKAADRHAKINQILDGLGRFSARLNVALAGIGV